MQEGASVAYVQDELLCCEVFHCDLCARVYFCVVKCILSF